MKNILGIDDKLVLAKIAALLQKERLVVLKETSETDKSYSIDEIRKKHPNAYMPWDKDDDKYLEQLYCEKLTVRQLSVALGRNEGAIVSRISKLELEDKYG